MSRLMKILTVTVSLLLLASLFLMRNSREQSSSTSSNRGSGKTDVKDVIDETPKLKRISRRSPVVEKMVPAASELSAVEERHWNKQEELRIAYAQIRVDAAGDMDKYQRLLHERQGGLSKLKHELKQLRQAVDDQKYAKLYAECEDESQKDVLGKIVKCRTSMKALAQKFQNNEVDRKQYLKGIRDFSIHYQGLRFRYNKLISEK